MNDTSTLSASSAELKQDKAPAAAAAAPKMTIFKNPIKRQQHGNKNVFDESRGWKPTKLSGYFNQRHQTMQDANFNRELTNRIWGGPSVGPSVSGNSTGN